MYILNCNLLCCRQVAAAGLLQVSLNCWNVDIVHDIDTFKSTWFVPWQEKKWRRLIPTKLPSSYNSCSKDSIKVYLDPSLCKHPMESNQVKDIFRQSVICFFPAVRRVFPNNTAKCQEDASQGHYCLYKSYQDNGTFVYSKSALELYWNIIIRPNIIHIGANIPSSVEKSRKLWGAVKRSHFPCMSVW